MPSAAAAVAAAARSRVRGWLNGRPFLPPPRRRRRARRAAAPELGGGAAGAGGPAGPLRRALEAARRAPPDPDHAPRGVFVLRRAGGAPGAAPPAVRRAGVLHRPRPRAAGVCAPRRRPSAAGTGAGGGHRFPLCVPATPACLVSLRFGGGGFPCASSAWGAWEGQGPHYCPRAALRPTWPSPAPPPC